MHFASQINKTHHVETLLGVWWREGGVRVTASDQFTVAYFRADRFSNIKVHP